MINEYFRGDDIVIDMTFVDSASNPLPPSTLSDYKAEIREDLNGDVLSKKFESSDFEVVSDSDGDVRLRVDRVDTATLAHGTYNLFVMLYFTDADAEGGVRVETIKTQPFKISRR